MATFTRVTVVTDQSSSAVALARQRIDSVLVYWQEHFSQNHPDSELLALNQSRQGRLSPQLQELISRSVYWADKTNGAFDLTILPIKQLWGFGENAAAVRIPAQKEIDQALKHVDYKNVIVVDDSVRITADSTLIDVGGAAKGAVLEELKQLLVELGYEGFLIEAGGDVLTYGKRKDGNPWRVAIRHPRTNESFLAIAELENNVLVTSGDYEQYAVIDSQHIHHLFNPRTGRPCNTNQSISILGSDAMDVDILATALFCLPASQIISFCKKHAPLKAIVVDSAGSVHHSDSIDFITFLP